MFGSRVYFAAGFNAVCDRVAFFREEDMVVPPVESQSGNKRISAEQVHEILTHAPPPQDGKFRVKASFQAEGEPLGNWSWAGVKDDDANDIIPHEDRRELRATRLLTAWLNHYDTGDNQTLSMWIPTGDGRGWVRHHMIDWNDSLGFLWAPELDQISRRLGYAYYFDLGIIGRDFISLGLRQEPWDRAHFGPPVLETRNGSRRLCLQDRAEEAGMGAPPDPWAAVWSDSHQAVRTKVERIPGGVCAQVPADVPDYVVIDVYTGRTGQGPARMHLRSGQLVGLERPEEQSPPPKEAGR